jgi:hypothetical protein
MSSDTAAAPPPNNPSVYVIEEEARRLDLLLAESDGELTPEIEAWWDQHKLEAAKKVDRISSVHRRLSAEVGMVDEEITRLKGLKVAKQNAIASVEELVDRLFTALGVSEISGPTGGTWKRIGKGGTRSMDGSRLTLEALQQVAPQLIEHPAPTTPPDRPDTARAREIMDDAARRFAARMEMEAANRGEKNDFNIDAYRLLLVAEHIREEREMRGEELERAAAAERDHHAFEETVGEETRLWRVAAIAAIPGDYAEGEAQPSLVALQRVRQAADFEAASDWELVVHVTPADSPGDLPAGARILASIEPRGYTVKLRTPSPKPSKKLLAKEAS